VKHARPALLLLLASALLGAPVSPAGEQLPLGEAEIHDLFSQGKALFREANACAASDPDAARELYRKAALRFERLVREGGIQNGKLEYDIGNAYFRMGDLGRAILHYRRAERTIPNDANLLQNLAYARSRRLDRIEEEERTRVLKTLLFWHYDLAPRTRALVFAAAFALFWVGAGVRLVLRRQPPRWCLGLLAALALLVLGSLLADAYREATVREGVLLAPEVVARKGDGETFQPSFQEPLHAGTEFRLLDTRGDWLQIRLPSGQTCWVPGGTAELVR